MAERSRKLPFQREIIRMLQHVSRFLFPLVIGLLAAGGGLAVGQGQAVDPPAALPAANPLADLVSMAYQPESGTQGNIRVAGSSTLQQSARSGPMAS